MTKTHVHAALAAAAQLRDPASLRDDARPLAARHIALLCAQPGAEQAQFSEWLGALGARVTVVGTGGDPAATRAPPELTARLLGRLYDAIDCCDAPPALARAIAAQAGVPVFDGWSKAGHPLRLLAELMTMRDASQRGFDALSLAIEGDERSPGYRALQALASQTGLRLQTAAPDFRLDLSQPPARRRLLAPHASPPEQARIDTLLADNRRRSVQAMVVAALS